MHATAANPSIARAAAWMAGWLTLMLVPQFGFTPLIWLLAAISLAAALLLCTIMRPPQRLQKPPQPDK